MRKLLLIAVALIATCTIVSSASAADGTSVFNTDPVAGMSSAQPETTVVEKKKEVRKLKKSLSVSQSTAKVTVLSWQMAKGLPKRKRVRCWVDRDGFYNSGISSSGKQYWFWDTRPSKLCKAKNGKVYRALCGNEVREEPPPGRIVTGIIVLIKASGKYSAKVVDRARAVQKDWCGKASAYARASARVRGYTRAQARGNARLVASVKSVVRAYAKAVAKVFCGEKPQPTQPNGPSGPIIVSCPAGTIVNAAGNCVVQSNSSSQEAEVQNDCKGTIYGNQCVTTIIQQTIQINANCSQVVVVNGDNPGQILWEENVICSNVEQPPPPTTCEQRGDCPPPPTPPKDGTQGPGTGTPGQPGGPGSGGSPGNPNDGQVCRDPSSGDIRTGPSDQFGYCV